MVKSLVHWVKANCLSDYFVSLLGLGRVTNDGEDGELGISSNCGIGGVGVLGAGLTKCCSLSCTGVGL